MAFDNEGNWYRAHTLGDILDEREAQSRMHRNRTKIEHFDKFKKEVAECDRCQVKWQDPYYRRNPLLCVSHRDDYYKFEWPKPACPMCKVIHASWECAGYCQCGNPDNRPGYALCTGCIR